MHRLVRLAKRTRSAAGRMKRSVQRRLTRARARIRPTSVPAPPEAIDLDDLVTGLLAAKRLGSTMRKAPENPLAISAEEIAAVNFLLSYDRRKISRMAELGTYTGFTANLLADLSPTRVRIEVYDLFEHNDHSRETLRSHPKYSDEGFFEVWRENTKARKSRFELYRGDLNETKNLASGNLDLLFVDIVKHTSLVNTVVDPFYDRLSVGGYLLHQDYYHWQSPWLVYQMELLDGPFKLLSDFGNNMSVYVKVRELTEGEKSFDYVDGLSFDEKYRLFDKAINRHPGLRAGNLMASKLRLSLDDPNFDSEGLQAQILEQFGQNARISGYAVAAMAARDSISKTRW